MTNLERPPAIVIQAEMTATERAAYVNEAYGQEVEAVQETARRMAEQIDALPHGEKDAFYKALWCQEVTARRYASIGRHPLLSNRAHAHDLPSSWYTLAVLAAIDETALARYIADGKVTPETQRSDAERLVQDYHLEIRQYLLDKDKEASADEKPLKQADAIYRFLETRDDLSILDTIEPAENPAIREKQIVTVTDGIQLEAEYHDRITTQLEATLAILKGENL